MKTLRSMMLGIALLAICGFAEAKSTYGGKLTKTYAIDIFTNAMMQGKLSGLRNVLSENAGFSMLKGKTVVSFTRKQMLDYLKTTKNIKEPCTARTSVIASDAHVEIVRFDMQFKGFVRHNYLTIANTGNGWKITSVYTVFVG